MTWFKVDDSFYDHPKVFDAPDCAVALWTRAGSWSSRNLTDGFVPAKMPARLCDDPDTAVKELVRRGLWSRVKDGYRFHDWADFQPSRESVERDREAAKERQRRRRAKQNQQVKDGQVTDVSRRDTRVTTGVTHGVSSPPPTRPDPTRTSSDEEVLPPTAGAKPRRTKKPKPSEPEDPTAQTIISEWLDRTRKRPPGNVIGQVGNHIKAMLAEGITADDIRRGTAAWMAKGLHPSALPAVVNEVMNAGLAPQYAPRDEPRCPKHPTELDGYCTVCDSEHRAARGAA